MRATNRSNSGQGCQAQALKSQPAKKEDEEESQDDTDQGEKSDSENEKGPGKRKKGKDKDDKNKGKWFDAETKCRKAERSFLASVESLQSNMDKVIKESQEVLEEFRQAPDKGEFQEEMQILERRMVWLEALKESEDALEKKMKEEHKKKQDPDDSKTTSRDMSALHRAGPCRDFHLLKSLELMRGHAARYRTCQSIDDI